MREKQSDKNEALFAEWFEKTETFYKELLGQYNDIDKIRWKMPKENFVVKDLPAHIKEALGTSAESLFISPNNMAKQLYKHPELTAKEYFDVFGKMKDCKEIYQSGDFRIALIVKNDIWYRLILKSTTDHTEAYMVSLHRLHTSTLKEIRKKSQCIN